MMLSHGLGDEQVKKAWQPFLDWVKAASSDYSFKGLKAFGTLPARHMWDPQWLMLHWPEIAFPNPNGNPLIGALDWGLDHLIPNPFVTFDEHPGAGPDRPWWKGNTGECGWFIWAYQSLWLPSSLLEPDPQERLADAFFAASRHSGFSLHFNKGLGGAPPDAIARARDTATNPAVLDAFALVITGDGQGPAYPGIAGHEPQVEDGRTAAEATELCMNQLRKGRAERRRVREREQLLRERLPAIVLGRQLPATPRDKEEIRSRRVVLRAQRRRLGAVEPRRIHETVSAITASPRCCTRFRLTRSAGEPVCGELLILGK
jgi:hypothetical protein